MYPPGMGGGQALKLVLLPVVGGISYEVIRLAGAGKLTFPVTPGMWLQRLTTPPAHCRPGGSGDCRPGGRFWRRKEGR